MAPDSPFVHQGGSNSLIFSGVCFTPLLLDLKKTSTSMSMKTAIVDVRVVVQSRGRKSGLSLSACLRAAPFTAVGGLGE
jgi:hypothetical protein